MRNSIKIFGLVCLLAAVLLSGCGGKSESQSAEEAKQSAMVETPAPASSAEGEAAALFAKGKKIDAMSFEYVITNPDNESVEGKAWVKGNMCKNEMMFDGETVIHIFDLATGDTYVYIPKDNMATLTNIQPEEAGWVENPSDYYDDIDTASVKIVGTETIAGYKCKVMTLTNAEGELETKMWVAEENGVPLRIESYEEQGTSIIEYKSLKIGSVSDDEFKLPDDVIIMDMRTPKQ